MRSTTAKFLSAFSAAALMLAACAPADKNSTSGSSAEPSSTVKANENGTILGAISYELGTNAYDPMTTTAALTVAVNWHTLEGLTEIDPAEAGKLKQIQHYVRQLAGERGFVRRRVAPLVQLQHLARFQHQRDRQIARRLRALRVRRVPALAGDEGVHRCFERFQVHIS